MSEPRNLSNAGGFIENELRLMGATDCIISTNLQTKLSGGFYANQKINCSWNILIRIWRLFIIIGVENKK